jgi:hypothetical protein
MSVFLKETCGKSKNVSEDDADADFEGFDEGLSSIEDDDLDVDDGEFWEDEESECDDECGDDEEGGEVALDPDEDFELEGDVPADEEE